MEFNYQNLLPGVPLIESPFFDKIAEEVWSGEDLRIAKDLNKNGYSIINLNDADLLSCISGIKEDYINKYNWKDFQSLNDGSLRVQDAWQDDDRVKKIATNTYVNSLLSRLYGKQAFPFQTLNFPIGTEQASHSDHIHFSSLPEMFMCGVWIAFEDVDAENGPLFYYPGSHKWKSYANEHIGVSGFQIGNAYDHYGKYVELWEAIAQAHGVEREFFHAKAGEALIWCSNLVHGGGRRHDRSRTRWSQVTHYFFHGCSYTSPIANDINQGQIYFRNVTDISQNVTVRNSISGFNVNQNTIDLLLPPCFKGTALPRDFNEKRYLEIHLDVAISGSSAKEHYLNFGRAEGRAYK